VELYVILKQNRVGFSPLAIALLGRSFAPRLISPHLGSCDSLFRGLVLDKSKSLVESGGHATRNPAI